MVVEVAVSSSEALARVWAVCWIYRLRAQKFTEVHKKLWGNHFWSPSYCAVSCGGAALETVKAYIQDQRKDSKNTA
jgi:putative transposase